MRFRLTKTVTFEAAHQLTSLPPEHQCSRLHGHTYKVEVTVSSKKLDADGFVLDFGVISSFVKLFDHQNLNEFIQPSTAENLAKAIWDGIEYKILAPLNQGEPFLGQIRIDRVAVWETATGCVELVREK